MLLEKARLENVSTERNSLPFKRILFLHTYQRNTYFERIPKKPLQGEKRKIVVNYRDEISE